MYERPLNVTSCHPLSLYRVAKFRKRLVAFIIDGFILALVNAFLQALLKISIPLVPDIFLENIEDILFNMLGSFGILLFILH